MKKLFAWLAALCLLLSPLSGLGEEDAPFAARTSAFEFTLKIHPDAFSPALRERLEGYGALLDALIFRGSWTYAPAEEYFSLKLSFVPRDRDAQPMDFLLEGKQDKMLVTSPLLGGVPLLLSNDSLLEFGAKTYEHLGVPLQYPALFLPHSWKYSFRRLQYAWRTAQSSIESEGRITSDQVDVLAKDWNWHLNNNPNLQVFINSLGLDTGYDETVQAVFHEIPEYIRAKIAAGGDITVVRRPDLETWSSAAAGTFYTRTSSENRESYEVSLPRMDQGILPFFSFSRVRSGSSQSGQLRIGLTRIDGADQDLLSLHASAASLPVSWPHEGSSLVNVSLTGGLFPNVGFSAFLNAERDGRFSLEIRKPSSGGEPGPAMITAEGFLDPPADTLLSPPPKEEYDSAVDILRVNDVTLAEFLPRVMPSIMKGAFRFLVGIPTSACQALLDDLTDSGILGMILQ